MPTQFGDLTVVEQGIRADIPPEFATYELSGMTEGEIWIYRPVCMREYVGFEFEMAPPPGLPVISI